MILTQAPPDQRKARRCGHVSVYDPSHLATSIRELAVRAHRLVRAADLAGPMPCLRLRFAVASDLDWELTDVHAQIARLERTLRTHGLDALAAYVWALRQKVEEYLA
jgi:hypothetical protein